MIGFSFLYISKLNKSLVSGMAPLSSYMSIHVSWRSEIGVIFDRAVFYIRADAETLVKGLFIIWELFRAHLDERCVYEILIKPSLSKVLQGMQFEKWTGLWKSSEHSICLLLCELLQWTVSPLYRSIHYVAIVFRVFMSPIRKLKSVTETLVLWTCKDLKVKKVSQM